MKGNAEVIQILNEVLTWELTSGVGIVPWSPLARGMLARAKPVDRQVANAGTPRAAKDTYSVALYDSPDDWNVVTAVEKVAGDRGIPMAHVALAWLLARPGVAAPVIGATKMSHLDVAIGSVGVTLTDAECAALEAPYTAHGVRGFVAGETRPTGSAGR